MLRIFGLRDYSYCEGFAENNLRSSREIARYCVYFLAIGNVPSP